MDWNDAVEIRLWYYMGMVHSACGLSVWCFSDEGVLFYTDCPHEQELQAMFSVGGCMEYALTEGKTLDGPFVMSDSIGLVWLGTYFRVESDNQLLVIVGPLFYASSSVHNIEQELRKLDLSLPMRNHYLRILEEVPVITLNMLNHYARMLQFAIKGEEVGEVNIYYQTAEAEVPRMTEEMEDSQGEGPVDYGRIDNQEKMILQCVRDGNKNYQQVMDNIMFSDLNNFQSGNPIRDAADMVVIFTALCSRAAMEGGLPPRNAKEMERQFIRQAEKAKSMTELVHINKNMLETFISQVDEYKNKMSVSKPIRDCCAYIRTHFTQELPLEKIAKEVGYTEYYLTRKFQKEMGVRLLDYIKDVRLEYAKVWLATTNKTIQDISDQLQFGARNYFSRVFKEKVGLTPAEYRQRQWNFKNGGKTDEAEEED